jgi:hypothetical protein
MDDSLRLPINLRIRPVEPGDFGFIRSLAADLSSFSVPSEYILWYFARFHPDYCRVLEDPSGNLKAYLLAMPTSEPRNGIAVWQIGSSRTEQPFALEHFAAYLRDLMDREGARSLSFTTTQESSLMRLVRVLAKQFGGCEPVLVGPVPTGQGELEFRLSVMTK